jgi:hypothetical protein
MEHSVMTSVDLKGLVIENAAQKISGDVAQALSARRAAHLDTLALAQENDRTPEMRKEASQLRLRSTFGMGEATQFTHEGANSEWRDAAIRQNEQISDILEDRIRRKQRQAVSRPPKWLDDFTVRPVDHSFWWAQTQPHVAPRTRADFRDDGLHFTGGPKVDNYDGEMHTSFGAVASFALNPERFPTSPSGRLLSSPHIELFGGVLAYAPDWDLIQGNGIASCQLFLRQTIFQWGFGPNGPAPIVVAEAQGHDPWRLYLKNTGYSRSAAMPGFKLMPAVSYNASQVIPSQDLWVDLEVRLDIYLNCTGALVWCDPNVLLRTFQWAPTPLP